MRRKIVYPLFLILCVLIALGGVAMRYLIQDLPPVQSLEQYHPQLTTRILDHKEKLVYEFFTERRVWVPLNQIPVDLQNAFIATEDDRFFKHWGISFQGMFRAAVKNFLAGRVMQGGSTITQQLSKLIFLTQERTFTRKIRELLLAVQIEWRFSKEEILQMYLNQVYFGEGAYGVAAAAHLYFGKEVQDLNLAECSLLAGLPRLPNYYSPFNNPERAVRRRSIVLMRMREMKYISREEETLAGQAPLTAIRSKATSAVAPYFVENIRQELVAKYGSDMLYRGGLAVHTTLDLNMQMAAERVMEQALKDFDDNYGKQAEAIRAKIKADALKKSGAKKFQVKVSTTITPVQGALVAIDPKTGAIRAMIGGRDFKKSEYNRATQAKRQPGSAFKAFVWLTALENGYTAASVVDDNPAAFYNDGHDWRLLEIGTDTYSIQKATAAMNLAEDKVWVPKNYDGEYFGPVTLRRALAASRNIVSVRLIDRLDPRKVVAWAQKLGIKNALDPVLSLALGTSVVTLLELTSSYSVFAAEGIQTEPYSVVKITNFEGKVLEENFPKEAEAVSPQLNYLTTHLLQSVVDEGTGHLAKGLKRPLAGKTGTSQDQRDLWFVGFSPDLACGIWMGYDDFSPLGRKLGAGGIAVPWWASFMKEALAEFPVRDFRVPSGITFAKIDRYSGLLANPSCPKVLLEAFQEGTEPRDYCNVDHWENAPNEQKADRIPDQD